MRPLRVMLARLSPRLANLDPRTSRVLLTAATSYVGRFGSGIVLLITIPLAKQHLTPELFGVWMMLSSLLAFFAFVDLGVGNGVLNRVTSARANGRDDEFAHAVAGGYLCTGLVGLIIAAAWFVWRVAAAEPTSIAGALTPASRDAALAALQAFALLLALNVPAVLIQKIQLGSQQGHWIGVSQLFASVATLILVPATLLNDGPLWMLVVSSFGMQVLVNVVNSVWWLVRNGVPAQLAVHGIHRGTLAALLASGAMFFVLQLAAAFAFQSDAIVLTHVLGPAAYGDFSAVQRLFLFVSALLSTGLMGLWPAFGDAMSRGDSAWARRMLFRALRIAGVVAALSTCALVLCLGFLTAHWLHMKAAPPLALALALATWTTIDAMGGVAGTFMNASNVLRAQIVFALAMASLAFAGKWWLSPHLGATGAVLATIGAYCLVSVPGQIFIFSRLFASSRKPK